MSNTREQGLICSLWCSLNSVRYLCAQLLKPHRTHLFCNKNIWLLQQDLKKQLRPNGTIRLHHFSVKIWKKPLLIGECLRLHAHVCQYVLGSNFLSLLLILSCGCPTTVFDFFTPCEGLRAAPAAAPSLLLVIQSNSCSLPQITCRQQGFGWPVAQTANFQVGRGCGEKPGWGRVEDQLLTKPLTWLSANIALLCFLSFRKTDGR